MCVWPLHNGQCNAQSLRLIDGRSPGSQDSTLLYQTRENSSETLKTQSANNWLPDTQGSWKECPEFKVKQLGQLGASTVHTSPQTHQELPQDMYPHENQALRHEDYTQTANRNCQVEGARACSVQFPSVDGSGKQLKQRLWTRATSGSENTITWKLWRNHPKAPRS